MFSGMNQVTPTGIGVAMRFMAQAEVDNLNSQLENLKLENTEMNSSLTATKLGAEQQRTALEKLATGMRAQGLCGITGAAVGGAMTAFHSVQGLRAGQPTTAPQAALGLNADPHAPLAPSSAAPLPAPGSSSAPIAGAPLPEEAVAGSINLDHAAPLSAGGMNSEAAAGSVGADNAQVQNQRAARANAANNSPDLPNGSAPLSDKQLDQLRAYHSGMASLGGTITQFGNSMGSLIASKYKYDEAQATYASQMQQGISQAFNSNLEMNRAGYQQGEQSRQDLSRAIDSAVQACAAGYRA